MQRKYRILHQYSMMTNLHKLKLMAIYTRPILIISGIGSLAIFTLLASVNLRSMIVTVITATMFKMIITALATILFRMMVSKDRDYFYINIGLHPSSLLKWSICSDYAAYLTICTIIIVIRHVIAA